MALPANLRAGLLPTEAEYLATSDVQINIVPLMRIDSVRLTDGVFGPLRPPIQASVPLWMALSLKKRKRCTIVCPEWLQIKNLKAVHRDETMQDEFAPMPLHYVAIAKVLLEQAPEDVPNSDEVRAILKSIREARQSKVLSGVEAVNTEHLQMENISLGEVTELRGFLSTAFSHLHAIQRAGEPDDADAPSIEPEQRQFTYSINEDAQGEAHALNQTPTAARTAAGPSWSAEPGRSALHATDHQETREGVQASGETEDDGAGGGANAESMNNMDLF